MSRLVYYHHPCADTFSLSFSSTSPSDLREPLGETDGETKLVGYPFETPVYVLYEGSPAAAAASDIDYDPEWLEE